MLAALALSAAAVAGDGFTDASGDAAAEGGDITTVNVTSSDTTVTLSLSLENRTTLASTDAVSVFIDADSSSATGDVGFDYRARVWGGSGEAGLDRWTGSGWDTVSGASVAYSGGTLTATIQRSTIGQSTTISFFAVTLTDGQLGDRIPDAGTLVHALPAAAEPASSPSPAQVPTSQQQQQAPAPTGGSAAPVEPVVVQPAPAAAAAPERVPVEAAPSMSIPGPASPSTDLSIGPGASSSSAEKTGSMGSTGPGTTEGGPGMVSAPEAVRAQRSTLRIRPRFSVGRFATAGQKVRLPRFALIVPRGSLVTFVVGGRREAKLGLGGPVRSTLLAAGVARNTTFRVKVTKSGATGFSLTLRAHALGITIVSVG